jgi:hypothetical protein
MSRECLLGHGRGEIVAAACLTPTSRHLPEHDERARTSRGKTQPRSERFSAGKGADQPGYSMNRLLRPRIWPFFSPSCRLQEPEAGPPRVLAPPIPPALTTSWAAPYQVTAVSHRGPSAQPESQLGAYSAYRLRPGEAREINPPRLRACRELTCNNPGRVIYENRPPAGVRTLQRAPSSGCLSLVAIESKEDRAWSYFSAALLRRSSASFS